MFDASCTPLQHNHFEGIEVKKSYSHLGDCIRFDAPLRRPDDGELEADVLDPSKIGQEKNISSINLKINLA